MDNRYWAADYAGEDQESSLVSVLDERVRKYQRHLRSGPQWRRLLRNLRYYHGNFYPGNADSINFELKQLDSGHLGVGVNHYRNLLDQIHLIGTGDKITFKTRAVNSDPESLTQARFGDGIMEYYVREKRANQYFKTAGLHALVLNVGFAFPTWDPALGSKVDQDPQTGETFFQGDFNWENPTIADVTFDLGIREWKKNQWVIVRTLANKWDLAAKFPAKADKIISETRDRIVDLWFYQGLNTFAEDDNVYLYQFFHKKTDAIPEGRHVTYIPGAVLLDEQLPYKEIPLFRCVHGEFLLNCLGYSVANDLQSLQECENGAVSAISTALAAHGVGHIWMKPKDRLTVKNFEGGLRGLVSEEQPVAINFTAIPTELWKAAEMYVRAMEYLSGINSTRRGQPEANLRTGKALQIVAAQAIEAASNYSESYREMCEDIATHMLRTITKYAKGSRLASIIGENNTQYLESYDPQTLTNIDRVIVETINPLAGTLMGRLAQADDLAEKGIIKNYREYLNLVTTGNNQPLLEYEQGALNLVREENKRLLKGQGVLASPIHPHVLHIKEHSVNISSLKNAEIPAILDLTFGHIMDHVALWLDPNPSFQAVQAAMSNEPPPFMGPPGMGGPTGAPPGEPGLSPGAGTPPKQKNNGGENKAPAQVIPPGTVQETIT